jgi:hypothetical protein
MTTVMQAPCQSRNSRAKQFISGLIPMFRMGYWSAIAICDLTVMHLPQHMVSEWIPRVTVLILNPGRILDDSIPSVRQRRMHRRPGGGRGLWLFRDRCEELFDRSNREVSHKQVDTYRYVLALYLERPDATVRSCILSGRGASDTAT